jgi:hypothetical protein
MPNLFFKRWSERRRQKRLLEELVKQFKTPIGSLPLGNQWYESDPVWQMANFTENNYFSMRTDFVKVMESLICITVERPDIRIPVGRFYGSNHGKSHIHCSLHDFAYNVLRKDGTIGFQTESHWQENIRSFETRFNVQVPTASLFKWSRRLYLWNSDQSHHLAALYRQSRDQNRKWRVPCNLKIYGWNQSIEDISGKLQFIARDRVDSIVNQYSAEVEHIQVGRSKLGIHAIQLSNLDLEIMDMAMNAILQLEEHGMIVRLSQMRNRLRFSDECPP